MSAAARLPRRLRPLLPLLLLLAASCAAVGPAPPAPVPRAASRALAEGRRHLAEGRPREAERSARAALAAAPGWIAPERVLDDALRERHLGPTALERRRAELRARPGDAAALYLVGRLEGAAGRARFEQAVRNDPGRAWPQHGLAVLLAADGRAGTAAVHERRALALAREDWERAFFAATLAGQLGGAGRYDEAIDVLRSTAAGVVLDPPDALWFATELALAELRHPRGAVRERGFVQALELLRDCALEERDLARLVAATPLALATMPDRRNELELALCSCPGPARAHVLARLLLEQAPSPLGRGLLRLAAEGDAPPREPVSRAGRFALGECAAAVEAWLAALPAQVLADDGLPADAHLRAVVAAARAPGLAAEGARAARAWSAFGDALVAAGWLVEARAAAEELARHDVAAAAALRERAVAGLAQLDALRRGLRGDEGALLELDEGGTGRVSLDLRADPRPGGDALRSLLEGLAPVFARAHERLGGETDAGALARELGASPRFDFGPFASVVHPGPRFSAADEAAGRGRAGDPVPGIASELARLGRFALIGRVIGGGGPDGVVLQRLLVEERAGEHLGVPWRGTVAWCDGSDVDGRAAGGDLRVTGAALHEGYWVDVESVRRDHHERWERLARSLRGPDARAAVDAALAQGGLALDVAEVEVGGERDPRAAARHGAVSRARRQLDPLLGEGQRVRLALLRERGGEYAGAPLGAVTLEELVEVVAVHEQGHLVDRALFLPLSENLGRALRFLVEEGLSPRAVQQRLEYRAELIALCELPDPRLALAEVLDAAESGTGGPLPHGYAYRELLAGLLRELERAALARPGDFPGIALDQTLAHQLHRLGAEQVRALARALAAREGVGR